MSNANKYREDTYTTYLLIDDPNTPVIEAKTAERRLYYTMAHLSQMIEDICQAPQDSYDTLQDLLSMMLRLQRQVGLIHDTSVGSFVTFPFPKGTHSPATTEQFLKTILALALPSRGAVLVRRAAFQTLIDELVELSLERRSHLAQE